VTDEDAIRNLLARYWLYLDDRRPKEWLGLFDEDTEISVAGEVTKGAGIQKIAADFVALEWAGCHVGTNIDIEVDGDHAKSESDVVFYIPDGVSLGDGEESVRGTRVLYTARCRDRLVKRSEQWLFAERAMEIRVGFHP
jgi:hypothetical protein